MCADPVSVEHDSFQPFRPEGPPVRTFSPKAADVERQWHVIDANDVVLGRLAAQVATLLRGKHKPIFAPHVDTGDFVIVINADKVALTGKKREQKFAYRHSGYPGGLTAKPYGELLAERPDRAVEKAVRVEFKFRRETLKSRGIDSIADWELKKPGFIAWLTEDWFRMTEGEVDRTNTSRAPTWHTWKIVQALFADWAGKGPKPPKLGLGIQLNPQSLIEQAVGCITQAMALRGMDAKTMPEFLDAALRLIKGYSVKDNVLFKLDKKFAALGARSPRKAFFSWGR